MDPNTFSVQQNITRLARDFTIRILAAICLSRYPSNKAESEEIEVEEFEFTTQRGDRLSTQFWEMIEEKDYGESGKHRIIFNNLFGEEIVTDEKIRTFLIEIECRIPAFEIYQDEVDNIVDSNSDSDYDSDEENLQDMEFNFKSPTFHYQHRTLEDMINAINHVL